LCGRQFSEICFFPKPKATGCRFPFIDGRHVVGHGLKSMGELTMTPKLLADQLRQLHIEVHRIPAEAVNTLTDQQILDAYFDFSGCSNSEIDNDYREKVIAESESVEDFLGKLDDRNGSARLSAEAAEEAEAAEIFHRHRREIDVRCSLEHMVCLDPGLVGQLVSRGATEKGATVFASNLQEAMREQARFLPPAALARMTM
jgi:hypothetical protein